MCIVAKIYGWWGCSDSGLGNELVFGVNGERWMKGTESVMKMVLRAIGDNESRV
jgi:hypothetical protein